MLETSKLIIFLYIILISLKRNVSGNITNFDVVAYRPKVHSLAKYIVSVKAERDIKIFGDNHVCVGTIISSKTILTSASCIVSPRGIQRFSKFSVVAGSPFLFEVISTTRFYDVQNTAIHPEYKHDTMEMDLAVLIMSKEILEVGITVPTNLDNFLPRHGKKCIFFGWGELYKNGPRPNELLYENVKIMNRSDCKKGHEFSPDILFCVSGVNDFDKAVWRGDFGSPLMCDGKLTGVLSHENQMEGEPILFTSVYDSRAWLSHFLSDISALNRSLNSCKFTVA